MARKQVTVNEEMIRGIMAGDIPNYGKDISVDDIIGTVAKRRKVCNKLIANMIENSYLSKI